MLDFTSALYLGMHHSRDSLPAWQQLTTGRPAALSVPPESEAVAKSLAQLMGCQQATLGTSTLHIFWDLFEVLAKERIVIYMDDGSYPIARWGVERVEAKGVSTRIFPSRDTEALVKLLNRDSSLKAKPVVVTDGLCPATGKTVPLSEYVNLVKAKGGYVVVDDTQALGILGHSPTSLMSYGTGGAGTAAWHGTQGQGLIIGSSLAKGFGVPLAVLGGSQSFIKRFEAESATRIHCSPPSIALIQAVRHALEINKTCGDQLRQRLLRLVRQFKQGLLRIGLSAMGGLFPVQTLKSIPNIDAAWLHEQLLKLGVRTVLHRSRIGNAPLLSFLITALHAPNDINQGVATLQQALSLSNLRFGRKNLEHQYIFSRPYS